MAGIAVLKYNLWDLPAKYAESLRSVDVANTLCRGEFSSTDPSGSHLVYLTVSTADDVIRGFAFVRFQNHTFERSWLLTFACMEAGYSAKPMIDQLKQDAVNSDLDAVNLTAIDIPVSVKWGRHGFATEKMFGRAEDGLDRMVKMRYAVPDVWDNTASQKTAMSAGLGNYRKHETE